MNTINVELAYAKPSQQLLYRFSVNQGTTLSQAIEISGIKNHHPEINSSYTVGIFSKRISLPDSYTLQANDRIEIYRPLVADPKEIRRKRAERLKNKT